MPHQKPAHVSLTALTGIPVTDAAGVVRGRLKDVAVATGAEAGKVAGLVLKTRAGLRLVSTADVIETPAGTLELREGALPAPIAGDENFIFLEQDLLDRQIIDIHGRKVVRVNDVDLQWFSQGALQDLRVAEVEVGLRGAVRRVFKGLLPRHRLEAFSRRFRARVIPWEFVNLIEADPARRIRLKIEHERLAQMHPSDLADILEELAPAEREAIFNTLDEEIAAEALEEVDPRLQQSLIEALDSERVADIVEEMDPGAAADLLAELPEARSEAILEEMEPEERREVEELLEFREDSAAGRMTTSYVALGSQNTVADAVEALRQFEDDPENLSEIYLLDEHGKLEGVVPLARLVLAQPATRLSPLADPRLICCPSGMHQNEVAELFDKYNLRSLAVVDHAFRLVGAVHADQVIAFLRQRR